jgi:phosphopantothenoylcysteine decarboxylase/phosphopantothenate--cysteine ligase
MKIVLGVTASVAIYKSCELVRLLVGEGADVAAVMTPEATRLVDPRLFDALTGRRAVVDLFDREAAFSHLETARGAQVFAVVPATANIVAKLAAGIADDAVTTTALSVRCPRLVAPAMNPAMFEQLETTRNVKALRDLGYTVVGPVAGKVACGDEGYGRLADINVICEDILRLALSNKPFTTKRIVITGGPTREPIDAVRYIGNPSSGLMGYELARRAARRGAAVDLITGAYNVGPLPSMAKVTFVNTAAEMLEATRNAFAGADALIMAAAVADYSYKGDATTKIKKTQGDMTISLTPTVDILTELAKNKGDRVLIGFAAEVDNLIENAKGKLLSKKLDIVVGNKVGGGEGFQVEAVEAVIVTRDGVAPLGKITKAALAERLLDELAARWR